jgi:hypothetical protein
MDMPDFNVFDALDIDPEADITKQTVTRAFHRASLHCHPDKLPLRASGTGNAFPSYRQIDEAKVFLLSSMTNIGRAKRQHGHSRTFPFNSSAGVGMPNAFNTGVFPNVPRSASASAGGKPDGGHKRAHSPSDRNNSPPHKRWQSGWSSSYEYHAFFNEADRDDDSDADPSFRTPPGPRRTGSSHRSGSGNGQQGPQTRSSNPSRGVFDSDSDADSDSDGSARGSPKPRSPTYKTMPRQDRPDSELHPTSGTGSRRREAPIPMPFNPDGKVIVGWPSTHFHLEERLRPVVKASFDTIGRLTLRVAKVNVDGLEVPREHRVKQSNIIFEDIALVPEMVHHVSYKDFSLHVWLTLVRGRGDLPERRWFRDN